MSKEGFFTLGYIRRIIGVRGELAVQLDVDDPKRYAGIDVVFIEQEPENIPLFLTAAQVRGNELIIQPEGISTPDEARLMVGKTVVLPLAALPPLGDTRFYFHEIKGFDVIDERFGPVGIAEEVIDRMMQPVLRILRGSEEVLLPVMPGSIQKVDRENRRLYLRSPEGLIELYLQPGNQAPDDGE